MKLAYFAATAALLTASAAASAWWGGPWGGNNWGNHYNNGYGGGWGGMGGDQYRGGDAAGGGDFSMNLSGRGNTNMRGYGSGYGAGDGWGRGYNYSSPYYGGYGYVPFAYRGPAPMYGYPGQLGMSYPQVPAPAEHRTSGYGTSPGYGGDSAATIAAASGQKTAAASASELVTDAEGMTLYTFAQDSQGVSNCYGDCAANWPPALWTDAARADGDLSFIERTDGVKQLALNGMPLYLWVGDQKPGDTTGDGVGGVWNAARR